HVLGVREECASRVQNWWDGLGAKLAYLLQIATEDGVFDGLGTEKVKLQLQEFSIDCLGMLCDEGLEVGDLSGEGLTSKNCIEHGHKRRLTRTKGTRKIRALIFAGSESCFDMLKSCVHVSGNVLSDNIGLKSVS